MMDCDQVFELITTAEPLGNSSWGHAGERRALAVHLLRCPECRQLEQQLAPAVGLFARAAAESEALPEFSGDVASGCEAQVQRSSPEVQTPDFAGFARRGNFHLAPPLVWWRLAAAVALGFVLAGILHGPPRGSQPSLDWQVASNDAGPVVQVPASGRTLLGWVDAGLGGDGHIIAACDSRNLMLGLGGQNFCCTHCHRAGAAGEGLSAGAGEGMSRLLASCVACHAP